VDSNGRALEKVVGGKPKKNECSLCSTKIPLKTPPYKMNREEIGKMWGKIGEHFIQHQMERDSKSPMFCPLLCPIP
jgi:hypothetical protein